MLPRKNSKTIPNFVFAPTRFFGKKSAGKNPQYFKTATQPTFLQFGFNLRSIQSLYWLHFITMAGKNIEDKSETCVRRSTFYWGIKSFGTNPKLFFASFQYFRQKEVGHFLKCCSLQFIFIFSEMSKDNSKKFVRRNPLKLQ